MKCVNHLEKEAVGPCNHCGRSICSDCMVEIRAENYCKECLAVKMNQEKKKEERSPVLAAILSFVIGGMGQIYNGQIGKGVLIFFTSWLIVPWVIGIVDAYKTANKINQGKIVVKSRPGCLIAAMVAIVVFFIGVFFVALLAAIAIPNLLRARINANDAATAAALKSISAAVEVYRAEHDSYPLTESNLTPYLPRIYNGKTVYGYVFSETFYLDGYKIVAEPQECGETGSKIFVMKTDGVLSSSDCKKQ